MRNAVQRVAVEGSCAHGWWGSFWSLLLAVAWAERTTPALGGQITWVLITGLVPTSVASCVTAGELQNSSEPLTCFADKDAPFQGCCDHENGLREGCGPC